MSVKLKTPVAEPKAEEGQEEEQEEVAKTPEETAAEEKAELARLKRENEDLKADQERERDRRPVTTQPKVTAAYLRGLNETQREFVEQQIPGMKFEDILRNVEGQEAQEAQSKNLSVQARVALSDAIAEEVDRNPQVSKLKGHIREYFSDISDADKADPGAMKRHMKKAITYAKGAAGVPEVRRTAAPITTGGPDGGGQEEGIIMDPKAGNIKAGTYHLKDGFKIEIQELIPPDQRKKMQHPDHPTGLKMPIDFDEPPRMR